MTKELDCRQGTFSIRLRSILKKMVQMSTTQLLMTMMVRNLSDALPQILTLPKAEYEFLCVAFLQGSGSLQQTIHGTKLDDCRENIHFGDIYPP